MSGTPAQKASGNSRTGDNEGKRNNAAEIVNRMFEDPASPNDGSHSSKDYKSISRSSEHHAPSDKTSNTYIYISHFLSSWGNRMWSFAVGLLLIYITPNSLQLTAIFGLTMDAAILLLGPVVGDWVDNSQRLRAARVTLLLQNLLIAACAVLIFAYLEFRSDILEWGDWMKYVVYGVVIILATSSNLASTANTISVEKDWIIQMCGSDNEKLATMTARMKSIDLTTQILAPIATGQVMTFIGETYGALFIAGWNLVSLFIEYFLAWKVYMTIPALRVYKNVSKSVSGKRKPLLSEGKTENQQEETKEDKKTGCRRMFSGILIILNGWKTYASYEVFLSGMALACLFMTVLGFDNVTVGYAKLQGLSESVVGLMMGGAGLFGIMGTFVYPCLRRKLGLPRSGMVSMIILLASLSPCVLSIWLPGSPFDPSITSLPSANSSIDVPTGTGSLVSGDKSLVSVLVMMSGIICARFGLWISDLTITQMYMQTVREDERGVVFGVQSSINKMMDMFKFGLVTALPIAPQFGFLIIISYTSIAFGVLFYAIFLCRIPKTLFSPPSKSRTPYTKI